MKAQVQAMALEQATEQALEQVLVIAQEMVLTKIQAIIKGK